MTNWKEQLKALRVEGHAWSEDGDIDSFRKGELEALIESLLKDKEV